MSMDCLAPDESADAVANLAILKSAPVRGQGAACPYSAIPEKEGAGEPICLREREDAQAPTVDYFAKRNSTISLYNFQNVT